MKQTRLKGLVLCITQVEDLLKHMKKHDSKSVVLLLKVEGNDLFFNSLVMDKTKSGNATYIWNDDKYTGECFCITKTGFKVTSETY